MRPSLGRRASARLVDALILVGVGYAWGAPLHFSFIWLVGQVVLTYLYFATANTLFGRTAGKAVMGLRVVAADGASLPGFRQALAREAFVLAGGVPYAGPLLALGCWTAIVITVRRDELGRGFHDNWAGGTFVTGEDAQGRPQGGQ